MWYTSAHRFLPQRMKFAATLIPGFPSLLQCNKGRLGSEKIKRNNVRSRVITTDRQILIGLFRICEKASWDQRHFVECKSHAKTFRPKILKWAKISTRRKFTEQYGWRREFKQHSWGRNFVKAILTIGKHLADDSREHPWLSIFNIWRKWFIKATECTCSLQTKW